MTRDATTAKASTEHDSAVAEAIRSRRTINFFKPGTPPRELIVDAVDAARWAPNHHLTEPWHFYLLGADTVARVVELNSELVRAARGDKAAEIKRKRWQTIPGWMVVTCDRGDDELRQREDYAACCCAVYSLSLCLWSRGVGVKWTTGDVTRDPRFYDAVWVDPAVETVVALLWYGYPAEVPVSVRKPVEQILIDV